MYRGIQRVERLGGFVFACLLLLAFLCAMTLGWTIMAYL